VKVLKGEIVCVFVRIRERVEDWDEQVVSVAVPDEVWVAIAVLVCVIVPITDPVRRTVLVIVIEPIFVIDERVLKDTVEVPLAVFVGRLVYVPMLRVEVAVIDTEDVLFELTLFDFETAGEAV
jgi:hypothetical protein